MATSHLKRSERLLFMDSGRAASGSGRLEFGRLRAEKRLERVRLTFFQVSTKEAGTRFAVRPLKYGSVDSIIRHVLAERQVSAEINASDFALVSVVGEAGRRQLDHWNAQAERVLADNGIDIHGAARDDISLSYLVPEEHRKKAVSALHKALVL